MADFQTVQRDSLTEVQGTQSLALLDETVQLLQFAERHLGEEGSSLLVALRAVLGHDLLDFFPECLDILRATEKVVERLYTSE